MKKRVALAMITTMLIARLNVSFATSNIDGIEEALKSGVSDAQVMLKTTATNVGNVVVDKVEAYLNDLTDIDDHWAKDHIQRLINQGVIAGYPDGTFKPNASISVAEFTKILVKSTYPNQEYIQGIPWYQVYIDKAIKEGIIEQGEFSDYTKPITRYEMARMIARAAEDLDKLEITSTTSTAFKDDASIATSGKKYIKAVSTAGIITGYPDNTFGPDKNATRAEASVMHNRFLDLDGTEPVEVEKDIVDEMIANVLATDMETLTDIADVEDLIKRREQLIHVGSCYLEDGKMLVANSENMEQALVDIIDVARVLQTHAEKNGMMISIVGGGNGIYVRYGENFEQLRKDDYMFLIGFRRQSDWASDKEIDGKTYTVDKEVTISMLWAGKRAENTYPKMADYLEYCDSHDDMEEDILYALYDGLRVLDENHAEELFKQLTEDYRYGRTHEYDNDNGEHNNFLTLDGQLIYKEEWRPSGGLSELIYSIIK